MSRHNYTQHSNYNKTVNDEPVVDVIPEPSVDVQEGAPAANAAETPVVEPVVVNEPSVTVEGVIANCAKLNVRVAPNATADILCVLNVASEIEINLEKSTDEWYNVCTASGIEGYCMRKFVEARL